MKKHPILLLEYARVNNRITPPQNDISCTLLMGSKYDDILCKDTIKTSGIFIYILGS